MNYTTMESSVGLLTIAGDDESLFSISFSNDKRPAFQPWINSENPVIRETVKQLQAYFSRKLKAFDLPLRLSGTEFQLRVWQELMKIPYGQTISYGQLASRIGKPKAARAVGSANHANPIAIVIPCHRVIGCSGKLVGYGGGLHLKEELLKLETANVFSNPIKDRQELPDVRTSEGGGHLRLDCAWIKT